MKICCECGCGKDKPHGQICWARIELEIPEPNNDEHYIESKCLQREVPICRNCLKKLLQKNIKETKNETELEANTVLLDIIRRKTEVDELDDIDQPFVLDLVGVLAIELHNPEKPLFIEEQELLAEEKV